MCAQSTAVAGCHGETVRSAGHKTRELSIDNKQLFSGAGIPAIFPDAEIPVPASLRVTRLLAVS